MRKVLLCTFVTGCVFSQGIITTVAGTDAVFPSAPQNARNAVTGRLSGVAIDSKGVIYAADSAANVVLKLDNGVLSLFAGNGAYASSGDGGPATLAALAGPQAVAVDAAGNVYIADTWACRVRKVSSDGIISTIAGRFCSIPSGDGGPATRATLGPVDNISLEPGGTLLIIDKDNGLIRRLDLKTGTISAVAGGGSSLQDGVAATATRLDSPSAAASDSSGNLFILGLYGLRKVDARSGKISTLNGYVPPGYSVPYPGWSVLCGNPEGAVAPGANLPEGMVIDSSGTVFFTNGPFNRVCKVSSGTGKMVLVAGNGTPTFSGDGGPGTDASLNQPSAVALNTLTGDLIIADAGHGRIRRVNSAGGIETLAGVGGLFASGDGGAASVATLWQPRGVKKAPNGDLIVADTENNRVRRITPAGIISTVAGNGSAGYSGDGGAATAASLNGPRNVAIDAGGSIFIADTDNGVIRKVTPTGIISTVAGNNQRAPELGFYYPRSANTTCPITAKPTDHCLGDNGPATNAMLQYPEGVAVDAAGNLYIADTWDNRIRIVTASDQKITTFAGDGYFWFNDGTALTSSLNLPRGIALDSKGVLYIADWGNNRIRKVENGNLTTVAGNGRWEFLGDGGPAINAQLDEEDVAIDASGNLYVADKLNYRIRKINLSTGIITTVAGNGIRDFSGDGGPSTRASLFSPYSVTVDGAGNLFISDFRQSRADSTSSPGSAPGSGGVIRQVVSAAISFTLSSASLQFSADSGGSPAAAQSVSLTGTLSGLTYTAKASDSWIVLNSTAGAIPGTIQISADPSNLGPGSYNGSVTISVLGAIPPTQTIAVRLTVAGGQPPHLGVGTSAVSFSLTQGAAPANSQIDVLNTGGGSLSFAAAIENGSCTGGNWLNVSPASGIAQPNRPVSLTVTATPGNLDASTYTCNVLVSSSATGESARVIATMALSDNRTSRVLLSVTNMSFTAVEQGGAPLPQTFGILNVGQGVMNWTATADTIPPGAGWLRLDATSGRLNTPVYDVSSVQVTVNPSGLTRGEYYGQIQVSSPTAPNSPQTISVLLTVLPVGSNPGPEVSPSGLIFVSGAGSNPSSQNVNIGNPTRTDLTYGSGTTFVQADATASDLQNWVQRIPERAATPVGGRVRMSIQPDFTKMEAGKYYRAAVNLLFSDGTSRNISILAVAGAPLDAVANAHGLCTPTKLYIQPTISKETPPTVTIGRGVSLTAKVFDDCLNPVTTGAVTAKPLSRDGQINFQHFKDGEWSGTWTPLDGSVSPVRVNFHATAPAGPGRFLQEHDAVFLNFQLQTSTIAPPPITTSANNSASYAGAYVSPGGLVTIFGSGLAETAQGVSSGPYPKELNGTRVLLGGQPLPLTYVGDSQVNAQIPFQLGVNTRQQLTVQRRNTISVPQDVIVAAAQPAIYTLNQSGKGPGAVTNAITNTVIDAINPVRPGDYIAIYCNGLGAVNPRVADGDLAPSAEPLARTVNTVTVTIGGIPARVDFAGLAPGFAGLYQVNAVVPAGVTPGDADVVVTAAGLSSPSGVTIAVR
jgi:uncharacterized protein (TIGR03437 family)